MARNSHGILWWKDLRLVSKIFPRKKTWNGNKFLEHQDVIWAIPKCHRTMFSKGLAQTLKVPRQAARHCCISGIKSLRCHMEVVMWNSGDHAKESPPHPSRGKRKFLKRASYYVVADGEGRQAPKEQHHRPTWRFTSVFEPALLCTALLIQWFLSLLQCNKLRLKQK